MNYKDYNDSELYVLVCEESEEAKDILFEKYKYIIDIIIKKYIISANILNIEYNDLYQEALVGFSDALASFKEDKASLATFITLCVERRLQKVIAKQGRLKNKVLQESLSLDHIYEKYQVPLKDILSDDGKSDPLNSVTDSEVLTELETMIKDRLSKSEYNVYSLMINGFNYMEIAKILNKTPKQIDNAMQRIKSKVRKILEQRDCIM